MAVPRANRLLSLGGWTCNTDVQDFSNTHALLTRAVLNPQEWRERLSGAVAPSQQQAWPTYGLVHQDKHYTIILSYGGTGPERSVPVEGGSGMSWTLVLGGELEEKAIAVGNGGPTVVLHSFRT